MGFFPVDDQTLRYMRLTGRDEKLVETVEQYYREQGLWRDDTREVQYTDVLELDMGSVEPALAGPKRPQDRIGLADMKRQWEQDLSATFGRAGSGDDPGAGALAGGSGGTSSGATATAVRRSAATAAVTYDDQTFELLKLCEESELKRDFFEQVFAHLNEDQLAVVQAPEVRSRVRLDIFSDALIYPGRLGITWYEKREDLVESYQGGVVQRFGLKPEQVEPAKTVIQVWVDELPDALIDAPVDRLDKEGMVSSTRANAWGRVTRVHLEKLDSEAGLTEDQIATIRGAGYVLVPLRKTADGE